MNRPLIAITVGNENNNYHSGNYQVSCLYAQAVAQAGGLPVYLPQEPTLIEAYLSRVDGLVLTGGKDPRTEPFGQPTHPKARVLDPRRQAFELALLEAIDQRPAFPVLGICLGMQLLSLHRGGRLNQYLPDTLPHPKLHQDHNQHPVDVLEPGSVLAPANGTVEPQRVVSYHQQAVEDAGQLRVVARAEDGVIEAVDDPNRPFYLGVQWHPERGSEASLSLGLFERFVLACQPN